MVCLHNTNCTIACRCSVKLSTKLPMIGLRRCFPTFQNFFLSFSFNLSFCQSPVLRLMKSMKVSSVPFPLSFESQWLVGLSHMNSDELWRIRSRVPFHTYKAQQKISRVRCVHTSWRYSDTLGEGWRLGGACGREDGTKSMQWKSQFCLQHIADGG